MAKAKVTLLSVVDDPLARELARLVVGWLMRGEEPEKVLLALSTNLAAAGILMGMDEPALAELVGRAVKVFGNAPVSSVEFAGSTRARNGDPS